MLHQQNFRNTESSNMTKEGFQQLIVFMLNERTRSVRALFFQSFHEVPWEQNGVRKTSEHLVYATEAKSSKTDLCCKNKPRKGQKIVFWCLAAFTACGACCNVEYKEYPRAIYGSGIFKFLILIHVSFKGILQNQMAYLKKVWAIFFNFRRNRHFWCLLFFCVFKSPAPKSWEITIYCLPPHKQTAVEISNIVHGLVISSTRYPLRTPSSDQNNTHT